MTMTVDTAGRPVAAEGTGIRDRFRDRKHVHLCGYCTDELPCSDGCKSIDLLKFAQCTLDHSPAFQFPLHQKEVGRPRRSAPCGSCFRFKPDRRVTLVYELNVVS